MHEPYRSSPVHHRAAPRTFVRVRGCARIERVHPIMTSFSDLGLIEPILRAVATEGYSTPTPIQAAAIPALAEGRDLLGVAQTGPGKTAAFVLPILQRLTAAARPPKPRVITTQAPRGGKKC